MTNTELLSIYEQACQTKGFMGSDGQFKTWKAQLLFADAGDLRGAIDQWFRTNTNFPMPAELLPAVQRAMQARTMETSTPRAMVVWQCPCCSYEMVGFLSSTESAFRKCPSFYGPGGTVLTRGTTCGAEMNIFRDERRGSRHDYSDRKAMAANG